SFYCKGFSRFLRYYPTSLLCPSTYEGLTQEFQEFPQGIMPIGQLKFGIQIWHSLWHFLNLPHERCCESVNHLAASAQ
ncbi:hypothetical protein, partial [Thermoleptolyngbya sp.]